MFVKICANTNLHDAQLAAELGAEAVGFVFAPSKRQVVAAQVAAITEHLPANVEKIGVFLPDSAAEIIEAVDIAGLTGVQLHGALNPSLLDALTAAFEGRVRLIQVVGFEADPGNQAAAAARFGAAVRAALARPELSAILVDTAKSGASGGLGISFDWAAAAAILREAYAQAGEHSEALPKLILAGGLRAENVAEAIRTLRPDGVDVASGVESSAGTKDPEKLRAFMSAARSL
jgi:phosphoribosylanthranilate isomerase